MRDFDDAALEIRLRGVLKEHLRALPLDLTVEALDRRREAKGVGRRLGRGRGITLLAAAALLLVGGALAAGSGIVRLPEVVPPVPAPSVVAVATASPNATPTIPSPTPDMRPSSDPGPSGPPGPLAWSEASKNEGWPGPVRPEPVGGATVMPMALTHLDPTGDTESDIHPWVDIRAVTSDTISVDLKLVSNQPPVVDPAEQWIAYGVVIDDDRDGVPDWRYGIDNTPGAWVGRGWRTNLHTGRTDDEGFAGTGYTNAYPDPGQGCCGAAPHFMWFELDMPFYTWASVIVNGRVVATDYAPDAGWLKATPDAKLGGTYLLEDRLTSSGPMRVSIVQLRLSMTVPDDWTVGGPWSRESDRESENTSLEFWIVEHPWDGCPDTVEPKLGPSFDDLVTYLADDVPQIDISESTDVTIDGYRGKHLRYSEVDKWFDCFSGSPIPSSRHSEAWILDVDGVRLVIAALSGDAPSEAVRSEVRQIVESIQIVGVWPSVPASPSPSPTPRATPFPPADGPVPPNARTWKVRVSNESAEPATLFVADEVDEDGRMARLIGSATPNVVPPGATELVTFRLPAKGVEGWSIFVNPGPNDGGLVGWGEVPLPGEIVIEDGQPTWRSP